MKYEFPSTANAIYFEDTIADRRIDGRYRDRDVYRDGRVVRVKTFGREDFMEVDAMAQQWSGVEYVGFPAEDA